MLKLLGRDIRRVENNNKLKLAYIDYFKLRDIDYIRENREVIELMFKAMSVDSVHEYRMQTDAAYLLANLKIDISKCPECSADVIDYNWQQLCNECGLVIDNRCKPDYKKYNVYKRITYIRQLIKKKLVDLPRNIKEKIVCEASNILQQFDRYTNRHFSYSTMFRRILKKLELYEYVDRFKQLKTLHALEACDEFYSFIQY
jgi:hypothetical protein